MTGKIIIHDLQATSLTRKTSTATSVQVKYIIKLLVLYCDANSPEPRGNSIFWLDRKTQKKLLKLPGRPQMFSKS